MGEDRRAGFEEFVRGQSASLLRIAYLLTGDVHAGEDLLQGVLEKMYLRWHRIRRDPVAYARRALVNSTSRTPTAWPERGIWGRAPTCAPPTRSAFSGPLTAG